MLPPPPAGKQGWPWTEAACRLSDAMSNGAAYPLVSIVTPSFNQAEFIEETIRSVLLQRYPNLEYIIIDGGSTDGSVEIIRKYEKWLTNWVSEPDAGQSDAINKGLAQCKGEIVAWINSDDTYQPGALSQVAEFFASIPDLQLVYGDCNCIDVFGEHLGILKNGPVVTKRLMTGRNMVLQPSTFFKRTALDKVGLLDQELHYVMDYDLWLKMLVAQFETHYLPVELSNYRVHGSAKTVADQLKMRQEIKKVLDRVYQGHALPDEFAGWEKEAYSNYYWSIGEEYLARQDLKLARENFWYAITICPFRPATVILLAYYLDTWLGTRFGISIHRLRKSLPSVFRSNVIWDDLMSDFSD